MVQPTHCGKFVGLCASTTIRYLFVDKTAPNTVLVDKAVSKLFYQNILDTTPVSFTVLLRKQC